MARQRAWKAELGPGLPDEEVDRRVRAAIGPAADSGAWVLVGGPPCQAYSLAGRSRNRGNPEYRAEDDHRHFLYRQYLRILKDHRPALFIMENVTGMLSAKVGGEPIFDRIMEDLHTPDRALGSARTGEGYVIFPLTAPGSFDLFGNSWQSPDDFIVKCERFGIPQKRHRVLLLGIREDVRARLDPFRDRNPPTLVPVRGSGEATVRGAIGDLPPLRGGFSQRIDADDTPQAWLTLIRSAISTGWFRETGSARVSEETRLAHDVLRDTVSAMSNSSIPKADRGGGFVRIRQRKMPKLHRDWYVDRRLNGVCNHETRTHMESDFFRYVWAASYAQANGLSPHLKDFPEALRPEHSNVKDALENGNFSDRFKVQLWDSPSMTVMSHIAKDGHYYIHPDPAQCRSLTVREAARLQTFPDNYLFLGTRTEQYTQVGNAVPPLLGRQIAQIVHQSLAEAGLLNGRQDKFGAQKCEHGPDPVGKHRPGDAGEVGASSDGIAVQAA
jgi:DNA (cytosine-5)-methyltransferase 1